MTNQDGTSWMAHFVGAQIATNCNALRLSGTTDVGSAVAAVNSSYVQNLKTWPATAYTGALNGAGAIWVAIEVIKMADFAPVSFQAVTKAQATITAPVLPVLSPTSRAAAQAQATVTAPTRTAMYLSSTNDTLVTTARTLVDNRSVVGNVRAGIGADNQERHRLGGTMVTRSHGHCHASGV